MKPRYLAPLVLGASLFLPAAATAQAESCKVSAEEKALVETPEFKAKFKPPIWTAPAYKIRAQVISERTLAAHPELQGANLHTHVPGMADPTEIAGTICFRIGHKEGADDLMVIDAGMTIVDPRMDKTDADGPKYEVQLPLHDVSGKHIGMVVLIFRQNAYHGKDITRDLYSSAVTIRDEMARSIPSLDSLFDKAAAS